MTADPIKPATTSIREARRQLAASVRIDWTFDWPPAAATGTSPAFPAREPVTEWRPRYYATSDAASSDTEDEQTSKKSRANSTSPSTSSFAFATASSLHKRASALSLTTRRLNPFSSSRTNGISGKDQEEAARRADRIRRRRRRREEDEALWNKGLDCWLARRDAWTCAKVFGAEDVDEPASASNGHVNGHTTPPPRLSLDLNLTDPIITASPPRRTTSHLSADAHSATLSPTASRTSDSLSQPPLSSTYSSAPLVPLAPPLLPARLATTVTPALYPSIYTKVVQQSLTPSIPINLSHMIPALVAGWKADGEWPPKSSIAAAAPTPGPAKAPARTAGNGSVARGAVAAGSVQGQGQSAASSSLTAKGRRLLHHHRRQRSLQHSGGEEAAPGQADAAAALAARDSLDSTRTSQDGSGNGGGGGGLHKSVARRMSRVLRLNRDGSGTGTGTGTGEA